MYGVSRIKVKKWKIAGGFPKKNVQTADMRTSSCSRSLPVLCNVISVCTTKARNILLLNKELNRKIVLQQSIQYQDSSGFFFFLYCSLDCSPAFLDDKQLTLCVLRMYFIYSSKRKINVIANYVCWYDFNFVCSLCVFLLLFLHIERILNN